MLSFDNPGLAGLAVRVPYGDFMQQDRQQREDLEVAKARKEARTKLLAEDYDYNNAMNSFDHAIVKDYATKQIGNIGKWEHENVGWQYNPELYRQRNAMLKDLKDNDYLHKGMRVDSELKRYNEYKNDPKNADVLDLPEFKQYENHIANYLHTGSIDGVQGNNKEFKFQPPFEGVDTTPVWMNYAKNVRQNGLDIKHLGTGVASQHQFVTDDDKLQAAQAALNDAKFGRIARKEYNDYSAKIPNGQKKITLEQYAINKMNPYFDTDKYQNYNYKTGEGSGGRKGSEQPFRDAYSEIYDRARKAPTVEVQAAPNGMREIILGKNTALNTNGSFIRTSKGNLIPINAGNIPDDNISTSNSRMVYNPNKGAFGSYSIQMPLDQLENALGGANVFDTPTFFTHWLGNNTSVRDKYKDYGIQLVKDKDGNDFAQIDLWKPMEGTNTSTHSAYNHGLGSKAEEFTSAGEQGEEITAPDGIKWQKGNDGNLYGSNGQIYSQTGQRLK